MLSLARMHAESGRGDRGREALAALEADEELAAWIRRPWFLTFALCGQVGMTRLGPSQPPVEGWTPPASNDARRGAMDILNLLAECWESWGREVAACRARSALGTLAAAVDGA